MRLRQLIPVLLLLASCSEIDNFEKEEVIASEVLSESAYTQGEARVLFSEELSQELEAALGMGSLQTKSSELNHVFEELGIISASRLFPHAGEFEERTRKEGLHRWYTVQFDENTPVTKETGSFADLPGVEIVEPVYEAVQSYFNDLSDQLWGLSNNKYPGADVNVVPVWTNYTVGSKDVIVAIIDEGVQLDHEDLAANCSTNNYNFCDGTTMIFPGDHGTHVSGTIAAVSNNGKGVAGIAGGDFENGRSGITLMSCQVFRTLDDGTVKQGSKATAIKWAADNGALISQNSWGYNFDYNGDGNITGDEQTAYEAATISASDKAAVDYFIQYAGCDNQGNQLPDSPMKGGVVIFAAGNDNFYNGSPANYGPIISVGAIGHDGTKAYYSNYGDWVDICAPGSGIYSTCVENSYGTMSGTSMACPHVSGVAALIVSNFGGQGFTNDVLVEKLLGGANRSVVSAAYKIGPLVDAMGSITYGNTTVPSPVSEVKISSRSNYITIEWEAPTDSEGNPPYGYYIFSSDDRTSLENSTVSDHDGVTIDVITSTAKPGEKVSYTITAPGFDKDYYVKVVAYSYNMLKSEASPIVSVRTEPNLAPVITLDKNDDISLKSFEEIILSAVFSEPDGHKFTISFESGSPADKFVDNYDGKWLLTITAKNADPGTYVARIIATDEYGAVEVKEVKYEIIPNRPPYAVNNLDNILIAPKGEAVVDMSGYFADPDEEALKYSCVSSNDKVVHISSNGSKVYLTAMGIGSADITVTASDAKGEKTSLTAKVAIKSPDSPLDVYPNPVKDYMTVSTLDVAQTNIKIVSSVGKTVYESTGDVSAFEPARIDMTRCAPGVYNVAVSFGGNTYNKTIVKL